MKQDCDCYLILSIGKSNSSLMYNVPRETKKHALMSVLFDGIGLVLPATKNQTAIRTTKAKAVRDGVINIIHLTSGMSDVV